MARRRLPSENEETQYWLSYSDMMAGLLLVFVLIITFTMMQAKHQYEEKESQLVEQQQIMESQQAQLEEQKLLVEEQQVVMKEQQSQLDKILGVRSELIEALRKEFDGTDLKVSVDAQTGAITFDSSILFDFNQSAIKPEGQGFLTKFIPRYFSVLTEPEFREYVSEIIIEGHTDTQGSYIFNLSLSQDRALSVAGFCLKDGSTVLSPEMLEDLRPIVTANGRSFSNPVYGADGTVDMAASRRVEFKFRLKDDEMIDEMMNILSE